MAHRTRRRSLAALVPLVLTAAALSLPAGAPASASSLRRCESVTTDGPCGMNLEAAWANFTTGDPHLVISYVEGGINWFDDNASDLNRTVYVNWHETPIPCPSSCDPAFGSNESSYDTDGNGRVNALDWAGDPRVGDRNGNGFVDAEDLIAAFSDGADQDGDGYTDDISGWDFYDDQNDPATYDTTYGHANGQMGRLQHECPECSILPVKAGAEALDRTDDLAQAWLFSADAGAKVITSTTADLGYSRFMATAVRSLERRGVAMVEASNDFDSADHQGGMFWPYVLPGNSVVKTSDGNGWIRSNYTSWGTHNVFSVTANGGTTSESTPTLAGVVGLLMSWGNEAAERGLISRPLTGPEAEQVMRATARQVTDESLGWPGQSGDWNPQYGYGIPDLNRAMNVVAHGIVPPVARIDSPDWYALFDPTRVGSVPVTGRIDASRVGGFSWILQAGLGPDPGDRDWFQIGSGSGNGAFSGQLGTLDLSQIPKSFWSRPFRLSNTQELETVDQYTVSLRLTVTDADDHHGVDRRAIALTHDPSWTTGFPIRLPASGESQPALVDLQGTGRLAAVFGDANGAVHAIDPGTGVELPGWPAHTDPVQVTVSHPNVIRGDEPILANVAVGDLDGSGDLSVVATSLDGGVYVFDAHGDRRPGWPKTLDLGVTKPDIPRPALRFTRLPIRGATAPPVLFDLDADGTLEIVQTGWDGYIHVWHPDGTDAAGWPVKVEMPNDFQPDPGHTLVNDQKLDTPPAIAYLHGRLEAPDLVVRPQYTQVTGEGLQPGPVAYVFAYDSTGNLLPGWPARMPGIVEYYGSAQEFVTEGNAAPVAVDLSGTGQGADSIAVGPVLSPPYLIDGTGQVVSSYGSAGSWPPDPSNGDVPVAFTTSSAFGKVGGVLSMVQAETGGTTLAQALLSPNSGRDIKEFEVAYPATGGDARPPFPATRQGIDFLGQAAIADVTGDGLADILDGGDSNAMHGYTPFGDMAAGFPKWTTGWNVYAPVTGDVFGNGKLELLSVTREGYLFAWTTRGDPAANVEWWRAQHDEWNTGNYDVDPRATGFAAPTP